MNNKKKLSEGLSHKRSKNFDSRFWNKFEDRFEEGKSKRVGWIPSMALAASFALVLTVAIQNPFSGKTNLTYEDFDAYVDMQFEVSLGSVAYAEVSFDDDLDFE